MTEAISLKTRRLLRRSFLTPRNDGSKLWVFVQALISQDSRGHRSLIIQWNMEGNFFEEKMLHYNY